MTLEELLKEKEKFLEEAIKQHLILEAILAVVCFSVGFLLGHII